MTRSREGSSPEFQLFRQLININDNQERIRITVHSSYTRQSRESFASIENKPRKPEKKWNDEDDKRDSLKSWFFFSDNHRREISA